MDDVYNLYQYVQEINGKPRYQYIINTSVENLRVPHPENVTIFIANITAKFDTTKVDEYPPTCWVKNEHWDNEYLWHDKPLPDDFEICSPFHGQGTMNLLNFARRELGKDYKKHYRQVMFWTTFGNLQGYDPE